MVGSKVDKLGDVLRSLLSGLLLPTERSGVGNMAKVLIQVFCQMV